MVKYIKIKEGYKMKKETDKKSSSLSEKISDSLFRGIMYFLYGKKAGGTVMEKATRLGIIVIFLVALILIFSNIKRIFFR